MRYFARSTKVAIGTNWRPFVVRQVTAVAAQLKQREATRLGTNKAYLVDKPEKHLTRQQPLESGSSPHLRGKVKEIHQLTKSGNFEAGFRVFNSSDAPNTVVYCAALNLCAKAAWSERAREIWACMPKACKNVVAYSTMINVLARCVSATEAEHLFHEMSDMGISPNIITYNSMINAFGMSKQPDKAKAIFDSIPTDMFTSASLGNQQTSYLSLMSAYARAGNYEATRELFTEMVSRGIQPVNNHFNALLTACIQPCLSDTAQAVFDLMPQYGLTPGTDSWTALLSCHKNDLPRCHEIVVQMRCAGVSLSGLTYQELLRAHVIAKDGTGARLLIQNLEKFEGWQHQTVMLRLLKQCQTLP